MLLPISWDKERRSCRSSTVLSVAWAMCFVIVVRATLPAAAPTSADVQFDGERAFKHLQAQCNFGPRPPGSEAHTLCLDWITSVCRHLDLETTHQPFLAYVPLVGKVVRLRNVIAVQQPRNPRKIMLSAHWDTRPVADWETLPARRQRPILGANDGASGVAVLLELARVFRAQPPSVGVVFAFFDGEDSGEQGNDESYCLGSRHLAEHLKPAWQFEKGINLDMVGDRDLSIPIEGHSWNQARSLAIAFWDLSSLLYPRVFRKEPGQPILDDHVPFLRINKPYINVIDFDYRYWHTLGDTEDKCSARSLEQVGRAVERFVQSQ